jgi:predicted ATPase
VGALQNVKNCIIMITNIMKRIRIKNFGPISAGYNLNDGWLDIKKVTFFCGPQGSGKSTIAKLVSAFSWIEKALLRGDFSEKKLTFNMLKKERFEYLGIGNFFRPETEIDFEGDIYSFSCRNNLISIKSNKEHYYVRPKIMYVPAERNFISAVNDKIADNITGMPQTLYTLLEEYNKAKRSGGVKRKPLPIPNVFFTYDNNKATSFISDKNETYRIPVSESASGFQSLIPLTLVSHFLSEPSKNGISFSVQPLAYNIRDRIKAGIKKMKLPQGIKLELPSEKETNELKAVLEAAELTYSFGATDDLSSGDNIKRKILNYLSYFHNQCFLNIVEEPEQNLYPASQRLVLFDLLSCVKKNDSNGLIITTHSPYMIYYLTLAIKAYQLLDNDIPNSKINKIINKSSTIDGADVVVYELSANGGIKKLNTYKGMPSDDNILNKEIALGNNDFEKLLQLD